MTSNSHQITNRIYDFERDLIIQQVEYEDSLILSSGIVELWVSEKPTHNTWSRYGCGILCITNKRKIKSNFFQLYDINGELLWEQEIYTPFLYKSITKNFHYFPAKDRNAGLNFAFADEADTILQCVIKNFSEFDKEKKSVQYRSPNIQTTANIKITRDSIDYSAPKSTTNNSKFEDNKPTESKQKEKKFNTYLSQQKEKAKRLFSFKRSEHPQLNQPKQKLQISGPNDFKHVQGVTITGDSINIHAKDEQMKQQIKDIMSKLNVKQNRRTEQFVGDFLKNIENDSIRIKNERQSSIREEKSYHVSSHYVSPPSSLADNETSKSQVPVAPARITMRQSFIAPQGNRNSVRIERQSSVYVHSKSVETIQEKSSINEPTMLEILKNELSKREKYLNQSDEDEYNSYDETDSEWN